MSPSGQVDQGVGGNSGFGRWGQGWVRVRLGVRVEVEVGV